MLCVDNLITLIMRDNLIRFRLWIQLCFHGAPSCISRNLETGAWSFIDIELPKPSCPQQKSLQVVSLGRLFLMEYTGLPRIFYFYVTTWEYLTNLENVKKKHVIKVTIWEVLLTEKMVVKVAVMPKYAKYPRGMVKEPEKVMSNPAVVVGCGDVVVVTSSSGRCVGWDLVKNCWHDLPTNAEHRPGDFCKGVYAGLVHLDLRTMGTS